MYFYHENYHESYHDACYADAGLEDSRLLDRNGEERIHRPFRIPAILNWLVIVSAVLFVISTAIHGLS